MKFLQFVLVAACSTNYLVSAGRTIGGLELEDGYQVEYQELSSSTIMDTQGRIYDLGQLTLEADLFSTETFDIINEVAIDKETGEETPIVVYSNTYENGTSIMATVDDNRTITSAEIMSKDGNTRVVREGNTYAYFPSEAVKFDNTDMTADALHVPDNNGRNLRRRERHDQLEFTVQQDQLERNLQCNHNRGNRADNRDTECGCFKTIDIGIVYDSAFCSAYGNNGAARQAIQVIVARASWMYQRDMCVKLNLKRIYTPDGCNAGSSVFSGMNRQNACDASQGPDFLRQFSEYMNTSGNRRGFASTTAVHMFTGVQPATTTIGCAWIKTVCNSGWSYGVDYASFSSDLHFQGILFAHELGHNLDAMHYSVANHIMYAAVTPSENGFSQYNIDRIMNFLDNEAQCDYNRPRGGLTLGGTIGGN